LPDISVYERIWVEEAVGLTDRIRVSKAVGYALLSPPDPYISISKLIGYALVTDPWFGVDAVSVTEFVEVSIPVPMGDIDVYDDSSLTEDVTVELATTLVGSVCWGHDTDVEEDNIENFSTWSGDGTVTGSGDSETIQLEAGQYMESPAVNIGAGMVTLAWNKYASGDVPTIKYKNAATQGGLAGAGWNVYSDQFDCLGWAQVRIEG